MIPLRNLTKKSTEWSWEQEQEKVFQEQLYVLVSSALRTTRGDMTCTVLKAMVAEW